MRDDMQVLTAMVMRLDGTVGLVLTELRAMHSQHQRLANRVRRLEERARGAVGRVQPAVRAGTGGGLRCAPPALRAVS